MLREITDGLKYQGDVPTLEEESFGGYMLRFFAFFALLTYITACGAPEGRRRSIEELQQGVGTSAVSTDSSAYHSLRGWAKAVQFMVESDAPDSVVEASINAAASWSDAIGREILTFKGVSTSKRGQDLYSSLDDNSTFVYYEPSWVRTTAKAETTLATTIWENASDSEAIVKGDVILNAQTYVFLDANARIPKSVDEDRVVDAETVLLHEFGHLLGLDHISEESDPDSIMHAKTFIGPNMTFREPSQGDIDNIQGLYN